MHLQQVRLENGVKQYPTAITGTIRQFCQTLYDELLTSGYSLLPDDIENIALTNVKKLAGWARLDAQMLDDDSIDPAFFELTLDISLIADEWVLVEPVIRAHCDLLQARRMEGSQAMGVQAFGVSSSEANQIYQGLLEQMKKEAFIHEPFNIELGD